MAPYTTSVTGVLDEQDDVVLVQEMPPQAMKPDNRKPELIWDRIILFVILHIAALYGLYLMFVSANIATSLFAIFLHHCASFGVTAGVHRLWSHRAYKATWQLRLLLVFLNTLAYEDSVIEWAKDHRVHHKYSETDADPHNARRGLFFSHFGWMLCQKHPKVQEMEKGLDLSDLYADPILVFQKKHYNKLVLPICFVLPTVIPMYFWGETFNNAFCINLFRCCLTLNATWLINSAAHMWGHRPYDKYINPSENLMVSVLLQGEGWHNYHHTFPWDYKAAELGKYSFNFSTAFIDFFAKIGWAYDLKTVSEEMIKKRVKRTGDGSHEIWGWGDKDQSPEDERDVIVLNKKDD